jgi:hypothetical protein
MEENTEEIKKENETITDALVDWILEELKDSGTDFLEKLTEEQIERVKETIVDLVGLGILAAVQKSKRSEHLREIEIVLNTLKADAALAVVNAQNEVGSAVQRIVLKIGGGFFS